MNHTSDTSARDIYLDLEEAVDIDDTMTLDEARAYVMALPGEQRYELARYLQKRVDNGRPLAIELTLAACAEPFCNGPTADDAVALCRIWLTPSSASRTTCESCSWALLREFVPFYCQLSPQPRQLYMNSTATIEQVTAARAARMLRELASDLADLVRDGDLTEQEANEWLAAKQDQWSRK